MAKSIRQKVIDYAAEEYGTDIEYLWRSTPDAGVFRHGDNRKWYGIIMDVRWSVFGIHKEGFVDVLNVKLDDSMIFDLLLEGSGFFPAYHMNKKHWISILLDGSVSMKEIKKYLDLSYEITLPIKK